MSSCEVLELHNMVLNLREKGNGGWRLAKPQSTRDSQVLLNLGQFLRGELSGFGSRIFFLDLLVDALGFERLVGTLVEFGRLQLGCDRSEERRVGKEGR